MPPKRILLMYVHEHSGHHRAALVLEKAIKSVSPSSECRLVDTLRYTHPILERLIRRTYIGLVKNQPEIWEYLYDNPSVLRNTEKLRQVIHKSHSRKFQRLLETFRPEAIACTQAFPCGIVSDFKATFSYRVPLYGVLTDFSPHSYWVLSEVDRYFVASDEAKEKLHENGIFKDRISVTGIPIDPIFAREANPKDHPKTRQVLVMGGSLGMGPIEKIVLALDRLEDGFEIVVVAGTNKRLYRHLLRRKKTFQKKVKVLSYVDEMAELMQRAFILVSKPGGLTMAEALASRLPIIFIDPIPGQEAKNASFLLERRMAVEARSAEEVALLAKQLLKSPAKIEAMRKNMALLARPSAALDIANEVLRHEALR